MSKRLLILLLVAATLVGVGPEIVSGPRLAVAQECAWGGFGPDCRGGGGRRLRDRMERFGDEFRRGGRRERRERIERFIEDQAERFIDELPDRPRRRERGRSRDDHRDERPVRRERTAGDGGNGCLSPSEARRVVASGEAASLSRIRGNIADVVGGEVVSAQLCRSGGGYIYVVNVIVDGGAVQRYRVDAQSGDLLGR